MVSLNPEPSKIRVGWWPCPVSVCVLWVMESSVLSVPLVSPAQAPSALSCSPRPPTAWCLELRSPASARLCRLPGGGRLSACVCRGAPGHRPMHWDGEGRLTCTSCCPVVWLLEMRLSTPAVGSDQSGDHPGFQRCERTGLSVRRAARVRSILASWRPLLCAEVPVHL